MKTDPKTEQKILDHINEEWEKFLDTYVALGGHSEANKAALKAGFYSGFKAGVCAMHDADKIL